jgi:uncharacterized protein Veg
MTFIVDKSQILDTFHVVSSDVLEETILTMAPSVAEYMLATIIDNSSDQYFNRQNIQQTLITLGKYTLHETYDGEIVVEVDKQEDEFETQSLW